MFTDWTEALEAEGLPMNPTTTEQEAAAARVTARNASSNGYDGASGSSRPSTTDNVTDAMMTGRRPTISDSAAIGSTATASAPVATETASDAEPGSRWYCSASCGSTGCGA